jgi:hypothetical protein
VTKTLRWLFLAAIPCLLLAPGRSLAVITGAMPNDDAGYDNVGDFPITQLANVGTIQATNGDQGNGYAAVTYIQNDWCIVPFHVVGNGDSAIMPTLTVNFGGGNIVASGSTAVRLVNPSDDSPTDLVLFKLPSTPSEVTNVTVATSDPTFNTPFYNAGFGGERNSGLQGYDDNFNETNESNPPYSGYSVDSYIQVLDWGQNKVNVNLGTNEDPSTTAVANAGYGDVTVFASDFFNSSQSDQVTPGDSGGGVFTDNGTLIGLNEAYDVPNSNQDILWSAVFGDTSYYTDLATYAPQINAITAVPEPTSGMLLVALAAPILARRRSRRAAPSI